jgi:hypothetical protein
MWHFNSKIEMLHTVFMRCLAGCRHSLAGLQPLGHVCTIGAAVLTWCWLLGRASSRGGMHTTLSAPGSRCVSMDLSTRAVKVRHG